MKMTENLKRCPFCGGKARLKSSHGFNNVSCENCGTEYPVSFETRKRAKEVWNKRPIENELIGKIGKLEAENKRLREALEEIKNTVKEAQDPVYSFHFDLDSKHGVFILETAENALKWNGNV